MSLTPAMPFVQIREWGDDAKLLAGGKIYFWLRKGVVEGRAAHVGKFEGEVEPVLRNALEHLDGFGNDFGPDSVSGQYGDFHK